MGKLSMTDLEILLLGIRGNGRFNETNIENSDLKKLGVGRILDQLASMKERKLIEMNDDGSFNVTNFAKHILWDNQIPLWFKILRVLEIKSQDIEHIASFLLVPQDQITNEIESLRKRHLVLMSPLRVDGEIKKIYEILPEGLEQMQMAQSEGFKIKAGESEPKSEIVEIIDKTILKIENLQEISEEKKTEIIANLTEIKEKLKI